MTILTHHPSPALVTDNTLRNRLVTAGINFPRGLSIRESDILTGGKRVQLLMQDDRKNNDYRVAIAIATFNQSASYIFIPNTGIEWLGSPYTDVYKDAISSLKQLYRMSHFSEAQTEQLGSVIQSMLHEKLLFAENVGFITYLVLSKGLLGDMLAIAERKVWVQIKYAS